MMMLRGNQRETLLMLMVNSMRITSLVFSFSFGALVACDAEENIELSDSAAGPSGTGGSAASSCRGTTCGNTHRALQKLMSTIVETHHEYEYPESSGAVQCQRGAVP